MQLGMIGLGRMGAGMVRRLLRAGQECVVHDTSAEAVARLVAHGAAGAATLAEFAAALRPPRAVWLMVPAAAVDGALRDLTPLLAAGDIVVDGGNSLYHDAIRRGAELAPAGIHFVDVGTSGGVHGLERGYCLMIGGEPAAVARLDQVFVALAPGEAAAQPTPGRTRSGTAERGYLHCGPSGAGHFVKMIHNGIEYGLMAAYAEGLNILHGANAGRRGAGTDAETAPSRPPERHRYDLDLAEIAELWRRGSVVGSWLLDLTAQALQKSPDLAAFTGRVSDSGEGRWTIQAAVDEGIPVPVLSAALFSRFTSRGNAAFADRVLSAMRLAFGGHAEGSGEPVRDARPRGEEPG